MGVLKEARAIGELEREIEDWVVHHGDAVVRYLTLQTGDGELAQDLAQETFARLYEFRAAHPARAVSVAWLYTVARRLAIDHWRAVGARPKVSPLDENTRVGAGEAPDQHVVLREQVAAVLARMPEPERQCLILFYFEDWSLDTIARALDLSPVTVRVRLYRARGRFRDLWIEGAGREEAGDGTVS